MGSWDGCCGISKLPINSGNEVVDFLIGEVVEYRDRGFLCDVNDLWTPLTIQTYGTYDDYGWIVPEPGWHNDYVKRILHHHAVDLAQGENPYHDIAVHRETLDYEQAQEAMHEGRLYLKQVRRTVATASPGIRVTRMMVHRFVFDALITWGIDDIIDLDGLVQIGIDTITKEREAIAQGEEVTARRQRLADTDNLFLRAFRDAESGDMYVPHRFKNYLDYLLDDADPAQLPEIITELAKFIIFRHRLSQMQILWTPQIGSQHDASETLMKLYQLCNDYAGMRQHDID